MDEFSRVRTFIEVVDRGGFSAAARQADVAVSSILRQVKALEDELGTRLLNRTTRSQSLTEAGRTFYELMRELIRDFEQAKREVVALRSTVAGTLTVTIRTSANELIVPALPSFLERYPELLLDISVTDRRLDLVAEGIDVAVWLGPMEDSSLIGRRLTPCRRVVCASPGYFARHGMPKNPEDLAHHNCLVYRANQYLNVWKFEKDGKTTTVPVRGNLRSGTGLVLMGSALAGLGLVLVQEFHARPAIASGALIAVFEDYEISPTDEDTSLHLVYPSSKGLSPASRAFIDFLVDLFDPRRPSGLKS
jgi:DNA-binding transcriptional LysR family regulator